MRNRQLSIYPPVLYAAEFNLRALINASAAALQDYAIGEIFHEIDSLIDALWIVYCSWPLDW